MSAKGAASRQNFDGPLTAFSGLYLQGILPKPSTYKSIKFITSSIHHLLPQNKKTHGFRRGPNEPTQVQVTLLLCGLQNA